ncbi:hypothetical protein BCR37DRAFT_396528 [Protomyces lactucae-debilis]|uniref:SAP domain-containing protein n=1 Tax=Protomyces lactucae-debilis TaxID=2754530 RepID=A0A1Y2FTK1_PROLT|nr:uncharacterized protein BCR37DRAFT_396528 [Protomyces lactucae-debilis]ORY86907.1 hypothetical protein BCR37DRAFT_396528 [Protomyces lactucae-debilis]
MNPHGHGVPDSSFWPSAPDSKQVGLATQHESNGQPLQQHPFDAATYVPQTYQHVQQYPAHIQQHELQQHQQHRPVHQQRSFSAAELELEGYSYYDGPTPQFIRNDAAHNRQGSFTSVGVTHDHSGSGTGKRRHNAPMHLKYHPYRSTAPGTGRMRSVPPTPTETLDNMSLGAVFEEVGGDLACATTDTVNPVELSSKPGSGTSTANHSRRPSAVPTAQVDLSEQIRQYQLLQQRASFPSQQQQTLHPSLQATLAAEVPAAFDFMMDDDTEMMDVQPDTWRPTQPASMAAQLIRSMNELSERPQSGPPRSEYDMDLPESPQLGLQDWTSTSQDWHPLSRQITHVRSPSVMSSASSRRDIQENFLSYSLKEANGMNGSQVANSVATAGSVPRAQRRPSAQSRRSTSDVSALVGQYTAAAVAKVAALQDAAVLAKARQDYEVAKEDLFAANENLFEYGPFEDISLQYEVSGSSSSGGAGTQGHRQSISSLSGLATSSSPHAAMKPGQSTATRPHRGSTTLQLLTEAALAAGVDNPATGLPTKPAVRREEETLYAALFPPVGETVLYGPYDAGPSPEGGRSTSGISGAGVPPSSADSNVTITASATGIGTAATGAATARPVMNAQGSIRIERLPPKAKMQDTPVPQFIDDMTVAQLKTELRKRGLMATGKKEELRERLGAVW